MPANIHEMVFVTQGLGRCGIGGNRHHSVWDKVAVARHSYTHSLDHDYTSRPPAPLLPCSHGVALNGRNRINSAETEPVASASLQPLYWSRFLTAPRLALQG